ncbi:hypothetical protein Cni_G00098 [Canna indica]|uniref:Uncharacterized protein n=1 Tax=Canna indica TaxID=4628 RepID=A0AAQ3JKS5_9LILI|nr:hypothetical protein Cni_G00098 [Canna indica]
MSASNKVESRATSTKSGRNWEDGEAADASRHAQLAVRRSLRHRRGGRHEVALGPLPPPTPLRLLVLRLLRRGGGGPRHHHPRPLPHRLQGEGPHAHHELPHPRRRQHRRGRRRLRPRQRPGAAQRDADRRHLDQEPQHRVVQVRQQHDGVLLRGGDGGGGVRAVGEGGGVQDGADERDGGRAGERGGEEDEHHDGDVGFRQGGEPNELHRHKREGERARDLQARPGREDELHHRLGGVHAVSGNEEHPLFC